MRGQVNKEQTKKDSAMFSQNLGEMKSAGLGYFTATRSFFYSAFLWANRFSASSKADLNAGGALNLDEDLNALNQ